MKFNIQSILIEYFSFFNKLKIVFDEIFDIEKCAFIYLPYYGVIIEENVFIFPHIYYAAYTNHKKNEIFMLVYEAFCRDRINTLTIARTIFKSLSTQFQIRNFEFCSNSDCLQFNDFSAKFFELMDFQ